MPKLDPEERKQRQKAATERWRLANKEKVAAFKKLWRINNRDKCRAANRRHGITQYLSLADYESLLLKQEHRCAICKSTEPNNKNSTRFCVDHCHETGKVRGLLCHRCNTMLGAAKDATGTILKAIDYLVRFQ